MATIYPSREEVQRLAEFMNISELSFAIRYLREIFDPQMNVYIVAFKTNHPGNVGSGCIFCRDKLCVIYNSSRTDLCNVFPWNHFDIEMEQWEENFLSHDGKSWCLGIGAGREWTLKEIKEIKQKYPNVGLKTKRQFCSYTKPIFDMITNSSISDLSVSEENIIHRYRSLPIDKKRELESMLNSLYRI